MQIADDLHLAYCTNVHRGETWEETFSGIERHTLAVRQKVARGVRYAIGLRLSHRAAAELAEPTVLAGFQRWLERHDCYIFTINGFPYGSFHGTRVKEQVFAPDWSDSARLEYTVLLFKLLAVLAPRKSTASVSTLPGSFKSFVEAQPERREKIFANLSRCAREIAELSARHEMDFHLGLEPEPLGLIETTPETVRFFEEWRDRDVELAGESLRGTVGVNYDCCHLAVEFESAKEGLSALDAAGIRLSKLHLSSALRVRPDAQGRTALSAFNEPVYLHQVLVGSGTQVRRRYLDIPAALAASEAPSLDEEWRVHFHVPLHASPGAPFSDTRGHLEEMLDWLAIHPGSCGHLEMETYTWEVLPSALRLPIEEQLAREYAWTLQALAQRGLADPALAALCREALT